MSVYVDEVWHRCHGSTLSESCHMMADTDEELEQMARKLRLRKSWRHGDHYDLVRIKRARAVIFGAVEITTRAMAMKRAARAAGGGDGDVS